MLEKGVGHVEGTSLPIGGKSTHAVLAAHRGLPNAKLFTDLDQMEKGDIFILHILGKHLAYKVDQIKTVLPDETSDLDIIEGEDHVTLITCTPYGVNTHRLLVRGVRTKYGDQIWTARKIPGVSGLPGMSQHKAVSGEDRREMPEMRERCCDP